MQVTTIIVSKLLYETIAKAYSQGGFTQIKVKDVRGLLMSMIILVKVINEMVCS